MKQITLLITWILIALSVSAQAPQLFNYQAIARDNTGGVLINQNVSFRINILQDSLSGIEVYSETHNVLTTQLGMVTLKIGNGIVVSGIFDEIDWSQGNYFLQIELDENGGSNYQILGTSQLLSVPYAMEALEAAHARSLTLTDANGREYELSIDENGNLVSNIIWLCGDTLLDQRDNQKYLTVQVDDQCWLAENLNIGKMIIGGNNQENNDTIEKYCYDNDTTICDVYGGLYQWDEMMQFETTQGIQGICPDGWHMPMDSEWTTLTDYLGGAEMAGGAMKETGTTHWTSPNTGATNTSGLTILPGGRGNNLGEYSNLTNFANIWSSTEVAGQIIAWRRYLSYSSNNIVRVSPNKLNAYSVRCLKDYSTQPPSIPSNPSPQDGSVDIDISTLLSWTSTDPEGLELTYDLYLGATLNPPLLAQGLTESTYDPIIGPETTYYWKVVAFDVFGDSAVSAIWNFTTEVNLPPSAPTDPEPGDASVDIEIDTVLRWVASDPEGQSLIYKLHLGTEPDPPMVAQGLIDTVYDPLLMHSTSYYWKVVSFDTFGDSAVSTIWNFTTEVNLPPSAPTDPEPGDASIDIEIDTVLRWVASDPEGQSLIYKLHLGTEPDPPMVAQGLIDTVYDPLLMHSTSYYWKVVSFDTFGDSAVSTIWNFTTEVNLPPSAPTDPEPGDASIDIEIDTVLRWVSSDPEGQSLIYKVHLGTDPDPPVAQEGLIDTIYNPGILGNNATYYWKVVAYDIVGDSAVSAIWNFSTIAE